MCLISGTVGVGCGCPFDRLMFFFDNFNNCNCRLLQKSASIGPVIMNP